jgi:iron(III) transport system substrate-binding protein
MKRQIVICVTSVLLAVSFGCEQSASSPPAQEVVVYTALDRGFSEPILAEFEKQTGVKVKPVYDTESTKTVGLTNRIFAEAQRPRCDVFWNNEILNTLRLQKEGLLQPCKPSQASHFRTQFRDPGGEWYGFAARARIIIVNTDLVGDEEMPTSIHDLTDPKWKGRIAIAKPLFGTTITHVSCLFASLGEEEAEAYLQALRDNDVIIASGNKMAAELVGRGKAAMALTDTDDAMIEVEAGNPVKIIFPDQGEGQTGTLVLPNTLALIKDCPHPEAGAKLIDFLLSADVEAELAAGPSAQIPLHDQCEATSRAVGDAELRYMDVDFAAAADQFEPATKHIREVFLK